jgi:predicted nucleic acid-binding protein
MILYLDTSALVKLFVIESGSDLVREQADSARVLVTHLIAYAESCSAFARLARERKLPDLFNQLRLSLDNFWPDCEIVQPNEALIRRAADFTGRFALRGVGSVHLAAAESMNGLPGLCFGCFDTRLSKAAGRLGLVLMSDR